MSRDWDREGFAEWLRGCDVVRSDGTFNEQQALLELQDYFNILGQVSLVYDHVTGGRISKQNTMAFEVIGAADDHYRQLHDDLAEDDDNSG